MTMPGYRERLKSTVIHVARELLARDGLAGLQARPIARGADCSVGTIYNLFGSLDMVIVAMNAETLNELQQELAGIHRPESGLADRLAAFAETYLAFACAHPMRWRAVFEHRISTKTEPPSWYLQQQAELFDTVAELLNPAIEPEAERRQYARTIFSALHGVIAMALDEKFGQLEQAVISQQTEYVARALAAGTATTPR